MSVFTKRRKIVRQKQEAERKRWEENAAKSEKSMNDILKTTQYIEQNHPEFDSLDGDERVKLFGEIYNKVHNDEI
jgi:hypothetical protein